MNFFLNNTAKKVLGLLIFPLLTISQEFVDDIYYSDSEVNYDFLDSSDELNNDILSEETDSLENYIYDENFGYSDRIERFENNYFDYYWDYDLYYNPWNHHYYNYHGIYGAGWPHYNNGWGHSGYYGWGHSGYYGWGHPSYGWGWPHHTHVLNHAHNSYYHYNSLLSMESFYHLKLIVR